MSIRTVQAVTLGALIASAGFAQTRQATIVGGGGGPDRGRCTVEVVVDDVAQVEFRGSAATLRTISGQPAQWHRFECSSPMPVNPANFRFEGVDGRGRQDLVRSPRGGGNPVVQIADKDGGAEGYTFNVFWGAQGPITAVQPPYGGGGRGDGDRDRDGRNPDQNRYRPGYQNSDYYRRNGRGFTVEEAVRVCQDSVMTQASRRFRTREIQFNHTSIDDNPGRQDWVMGTLDVGRGPRQDRYRFSCSVNFNNGRVRTVDLDRRPMPDRR